MGAQMFAMSTVLLCYLRFQCSLFSDTTTATNIGNERYGPHLVETPEPTCSMIWDHESLELEWLRWDETLKCDQEESYPFLDIPRSDVLMTGDREHSLTECQTSGLQTKQQSDSIKAKLTAESSQAYYAQPGSHGDADIVCILSPQIPPLSAPDVCRYINPRVTFWTEHLLAYADVKKQHTKAMNYFTSLFMVLSSALLREAEESFPLASNGF